jgi:hypothetical protein
MGKEMKSFDNMLDFAEHLAVVAIAVEITEKEILEYGAKVIEKRAKEKFGEYQQQVGPFIAWPELAESTKADRTAQGYPEDEPLLRSGETRESIEHTVDRHEAQIGSNSDILVYQELGTQHIPPRSTLGGAAAEKSKEIADKAGRAIITTLIGEKVFEGALLIEG